MLSKCPGQDTRWRTCEQYECVHCGAKEEIWSHETRVRCPNCGEWIFKEQLPSCIRWCKAAKECVGEQRWKMAMGLDQ